MRQRIALAALAVAALTAPVGNAEPVTEDSPMWDCRTMGNHVCGPLSDHTAGEYIDGALRIRWDDMTH